METVKLGMLGLGTVGSGVLEMIENNENKIRNIIGRELSVKTVVVRHPEKHQNAATITKLTTEFEEVLNDEEIQIVVELIGGIHPAKEYIEQLLKAHKNVVTANKDLIASYGPELAALAYKNHCDLMYEASVAGGIPILVTILTGQGMWFGWSFMAMVILLTINFCLILPLKFPVANQADGSAVNERESELKGVAKKVMTGALVVYGYSSMALMIWFTQWITMFAQQTMHMSDGAAHFLLSLYSIGSITGVLVLFALLGRNVKESRLLLIVNAIALAALLVIMQSGQLLLTQIASFAFGFSAASGIMQTGLTIFMKLYPTHRGMITGVFYFFGSIASFTVPIITGMLSDISMAAVMAGDLVMAGIGILVAVIVLLAEKKG